MSTSTTKALQNLHYQLTGQKATGNSATKVIDEIAANYTVKQAAAVADAVSTPTKAEFNALLEALREAGIIAENSVG